MANEWQIGLVIIIVAVIIIALLFKSSDSSFSGKFFKVILGLGCIFAVFCGIMFIYDDASSDIGDGNDSGYESSSYYNNDDDDSYLYDDDDDDNNGGEVSFRGSETSRKRGTKCHHIDYGSGSTRECSDKSGGCSGFSSKNRDAYQCAKCEHHVDEHY